MYCPVCGGKTTVIETASEGVRIFRIRRCARCKEQIVTVEEQSVNPEDRLVLRRLRFDQRYNRRLEHGELYRSRRVYDDEF